MCRQSKILRHSPLNKVGMLQLPDGQWTNNLDEAYTHLLDTHCPRNSKVDKYRVINIPRQMPLFNRDVVQRIITEDRKSGQ